MLGDGSLDRHPGRVWVAVAEKKMALKPGDKVLISRTVETGIIGRMTVTHFGIYIGPVENGIPSVVENAFGSGTDIVSLEEFRSMGDWESFRWESHSEEHSCFGQDEVIARALSHVGENYYDFLNKNCEHFADWCWTGQWRSKQVEAGVQMVSNVIGSFFSAVQQR